MYSKTLLMAMLTLALCGSCSIRLPWANEPTGQEVNVVFVVRNNLLFLPSALVDGQPGQFLFGSAEQQTVLDTRFASSLPARQGSFDLELSPSESLRFTPVLLDLRGVADGFIGADVWGNHAVTIDYNLGLLTYQREGIHPGLMTVYRFSAEPRVSVVVDGNTVSAIVDTASPDTLVLPVAGRANARGHAHVQIAGTDFGNVDVRFANVAAPRLGNRLLSKFLVTIDYGQKEVGLWRDPRM